MHGVRFNAKPLKIIRNDDIKIPESTKNWSGLSTKSSLTVLFFKKLFNCLGVRYPEILFSTKKIIFKF